MVDFIPFIIVFMVLAALFKLNDLLVIFYFLIGVFLINRIWCRYTLKQLTMERIFPHRCFLNQSIPVQINIKNNGWLPVIWLQILENLPLALISPNYFQSVITVRAHQTQTIQYSLIATKRGFYSLGPATLITGNILGLSKDNEEKSVSEDNLIIYPKIVPLARLALDSRFPYGTLHSRRPIYEDPTQILGKRDYVEGDSIRKIDWKSSAIMQKLQVKVFEPSIAISACIFLNLDSRDFDIHQLFTAPELAIVAAASLANYLIQKRQSVGLISNGKDPLSDTEQVIQLLPRKGSNHLMNILEVLAKIQTGNHLSYLNLLSDFLSDLPWGTACILITCHLNDDLFHQLFKAQRLGMIITIILVGEQPDFIQVQAKARQFGFSITRIITEADLSSL